MFTKTGQWSDPQGTTHTDAVFKVVESKTSENGNSSYRYQLPFNGNPSSENTDSNNSKNTRYRMYYWTNQAAFDADGIPYVLANVDPLGEYFSLDSSDVIYDDLTPEQIADKHCQEVVLA